MSDTINNLTKYTIITGHYGSGKTNFAANLAIYAAESCEKITVVDLDTVNPYFRSADLAELFAEKGITLAAPLYANSSLDIPALSFNLEEFTEGKVIIDVGGDDSGAAVLRRYSDFFRENAAGIETVFAVNMYRRRTETAEEALIFMREIEYASGLMIDSVVNNSNLGKETSPSVIEKSISYADNLCSLSGLPLRFTVDTSGGANVPHRFPAKVYIGNNWD